MSEKTIDILGIDVDEEEDRGSIRDFIFGWNTVDIDTLDKNLKEMLGKVNTIIDGLPQPEDNKDFQLDTIEFQLNVTASGKVGLMGSGMGDQKTGGIRLTLKRKVPNLISSD